MNYSLYPDILPSPTKNPLHKDYFNKEEINTNNDNITKVKLYLLFFVILIYRSIFKYD